ncbi:MAG: hypothetical protein IJ529_02760 [Alphaproteobacteria bacterium]|nr:hypothetical protein [Alphaproteobacteria bacterium]
MKTKNFWSFIAAAVIMTVGMVFVSCGDDEDSVLDNPQIVASSVTASGADENISSSSVTGSDGLIGTQLSYQSWIAVAGQTRAAFEKRIAVTLTDRLSFTSVSQTVTGFEFGTPVVSREHKKLGSRLEQDYVTITDSALVYTLTYANGFKLVYELVYEVPVYDDGITKITMPYYQIESIEDNGLTISDLADETAEGKVWKRKNCTHSITVWLNGQSFVISSQTEAKSEQQEDVLQSSIVAKEGYELVSYDDEICEGVFKSWLEIKQIWSLGGAKSVKKEVLIKHRVEFPNGSSVKRVDSRYTKWDDFALAVSSTAPTLESESNPEENVSVKTWNLGKSVKITKAEDPDFRMDSYVGLIYDEVTYEDGKLNHKFPSPQFSDLDAAISLSSDWKEQSSNYLAEVRLYLAISYGSELTYKCSIGYPLMYMMR